LLLDQPAAHEVERQCIEDSGDRDYPDEVEKVGPVQVPLDEAALSKGVSVPESSGLRIQGELRTTEMDGLADSPDRRRTASTRATSSRGLNGFTR